MGVRGELFSTKVSLQNRTYFFNVKENRLGDLYLNVVESKNRDEGGFERQSIILFAEDLQEFLSGFDESLKVLERAVREKRKGAPKRDAAPRRPSSDSEEMHSEHRSEHRRERPMGGRPPRPRPMGPRSRDFSRDRDERPDRRRRDRDDREERGERRPRFGESRPWQDSGSGSTFRERERPPRRSEGRPREPRESRDGYRNKDKPSFGPKKRVVVRKR